MTNIEKLTLLGIVGEVRKQRGSKSSDETTKDEEINKMDNSDLIKNWCAFTFGNPMAWSMSKSRFDALEKMDKRT